MKCRTLLLSTDVPAVSLPSNLVTGKLERFAAHAVVIATGGYGNAYLPVYQRNGVATVRLLFSATSKGAYLANPCYGTDSPDLYSCTR